MDVIKAAHLLKNKLLKVQKQFNIVINVTILNKLLYIIYGTYLVKYNKPIFYDQPRCNKAGPIFYTLSRAVGFKEFDFDKHSKIKLKEEEKKILPIIEVVVKSFGMMNETQLIEFCTRKKGAWRKANKRNYDFWGNVIHDEDIYEEFKKIVKFK